MITEVNLMSNQFANNDEAIAFCIYCGVLEHLKSPDWRVSSLEELSGNKVATQTQVYRVELKCFLSKTREGLSKYKRKEIVVTSTNRSMKNIFNATIRALKDTCRDSEFSIKE